MTFGYEIIHTKLSQVDLILSGLGIIQILTVKFMSANV